MKYFLFFIPIIFLVGCDYQETKTTKVSSDNGINITTSKDSTVIVGDTSLNNKTDISSDGTLSGTNIDSAMSIDSPQIKESLSFVVTGSKELAEKVFGTEYEVIETNLKSTYDQIAEVTTSEANKIKDEFLNLFNNQAKE